MEAKTEQIRIKLSIPNDAVEYFLLQKQWENEGGSTRDQVIDSLIPEENLPMKPGEHFKVLKGSIERSGRDVYYIAEIEKIPVKTMPWKEL